jgi:hypothetical protein
MISRAVSDLVLYQHWRAAQLETFGIEANGEQRAAIEL